MADSDKNILITPNIGSTNDPNIEFTGFDNNTVTLSVLDDGTLSFEGSAGQLFSVTDSLTGTIFSVNDVSGIPSIEVDADGTIRLAEFGGNVLIGTATDDGTNLLQVDGSASFTSLQVGATSVSGHYLYIETRNDYANDTAAPHIWFSDGLGGGPFPSEGAHWVFEGRQSDRDIIFRTNGANRLTVEGSGGIVAGGNLLLNVDNAEINLKSGATGTNGALNWTFNTDSTNYASLQLPYDTRNTTGFHIDSGYPITIDATTAIKFAISGNNKGTFDNSGLTVVNTVTAAAFSGPLSGNATTATTLQTARTINGVSFNGSANITVADATKLPLTGGTLTGKLVLDDVGYSLGNEYHKWKRAYSVNTSSPQEILYSDGNSLPAGGVYRFTAHIDGTGTDQFATAVYWNQNGTWRINVTGQSGTTSNHPEFIIDSTTNKPTIHIDHASSYSIQILAERIELTEGTGVDNAGYAFGTDAFLGSVNNNLYFLPGGTTATGPNSYDDGNKVFHDGYHPNADTLTTARTINGVAFDGSANITIESGLPLTGGTLTGNLDVNADINGVNNIYLAGSLYHEGDTNTRLLFGTDTVTLQTAGSSEVTVNATGVRLGDTGNGYFQPVSGNYGSVQVDGGAHGGYEGYSIGGRAVFMHNNSTTTGIYNDVENEWLCRGVHNAAFYLYHNGGIKFETTSTGAAVTGILTATEVQATSDETLKTNIVTIPAPLEKIEAIRGVNFNWKEDDKYSMGVIAQEVEKIIPEAVGIDENGIRSVNYASLVGLLIEAVKTLSDRIDDLEGK